MGSGIRAGRKFDDFSRLLTELSFLIWRGAAVF